MPKDIRPTPNIIREAIFDIMGQRLEDISFLELFAGSGAVGFEAYSRGAVQVTLVERDPACIRVIGENLKVFNISTVEQGSDEFQVINGDVFAVIKYLASRGRKFHIVFLDPPYSQELVKKTLKTLEAYDILHPDSFLIVQHDKREALPDTEGRFLIIKQRKYGTSFLTFYQKQQPQSEEGRDIKP